ncbi:hypothetical protein BDV25DRAFT_135175 [Aspergillus avenaceus]|uniref:Uncharacterized protein n=1 Tax=Aspergillus avenaceus TaxID=36643 RepID=A0A5N6UAC4_ASPAV|nr:hypothetical protein BDV25DRAFT_135175 [Aspergillus avenaceus]
MTDAAGERFLRKHFRSRPDIIDTYFALPSTTHKADFLRYLVLFAEGGVWFDRISCENTPIRDWIPKGFKDVVNLVVGLEADMGLNDDARQFAPWAIMAAPKSPHVLRFINDIVGAVHGAAKGDKLAGLGDVSGLTGPKRFTRAVLESLEISTNGTVDKNGIAHLLRPLLVGDVAIMPGYSFAASLNTYEAGVGTRLVRHHSN